MKRLKDNLERKFSEFESQHKTKLWFKLGKLLYRLFWLGIAVLLGLIGAFLWFFSGDIDDDDHKKGGITDQPDRGPDDIWQQTSGNDYYKNDPPGPFS